MSNFLGRFQRQPLTQLFCSGKWKKWVTFYCLHSEVFLLLPCNPKPMWAPVSNVVYNYCRPAKGQPLELPTLQRQNIWIVPIRCDSPSTACSMAKLVLIFSGFKKGDSGNGLNVITCDMHGRGDGWKGKQLALSCLLYQNSFIILQNSFLFIQKLYYLFYL